MTENNPFLGDNFLLENKMAEVLYHDYAKSLPIIDYHNHLPPDQIANNNSFSNITKAWLNGDHYKWRAMRAMGIDEYYITGDASDKEKFFKWAETVPYTLRNPLFHWTHLELRRYFGINKLLNPKSAQQIYEQCNEQLSMQSHTSQGLLRQMNVEVVCSTDDPVDDLTFHQKHKKEGNTPAMYPAFRPDKILSINNPQFTSYIKELEKTSGRVISSFEPLILALKDRLEYFHQNGCRLSDHGLGKVYFRKTKLQELEWILKKRLNGEFLNPNEVQGYVSAILLELGKQYAEKGWVMQLHLGALRNNSKRMLGLLGPDTGFDSIGDFNQAKDLSAFLSALDQTHQLPKTILYNLNPRDNEVFATMAGNFNDGSYRGKMQWGSAWWFLDQKDGMEKQLNTLSNMSLLSCFVGMLTDSRSFLSFPRHEYFRRILCNLIGGDVQKGELPNDEKWLGEMIMDICYRNAKRYFDFPNYLTN